MPSSSKVVEIDTFRRNLSHLIEQEVINDIGGRTFIFMRDEADAAGVFIRDVIAEHMLGLSMVVESVEGTSAARRLLNKLESNLSE